MSPPSPQPLNEGMSKRTSIFGLRLWVVLGICVGAAIVIFLFLISLWITTRRNRKSSSSSLLVHKNSAAIPNVSREIQEIRVDSTRNPDSDIFDDEELQKKKIGVESGKGFGLGYGEMVLGPEVSHLGWGHWYTLRELEEATKGFTDGHVIGEGGCGIVYGGTLGDSTNVVIKNLLNNRGQAEREFKVEVEAIGRVCHKNLVRLLGYCAEGAHM